MTSELRLVQEFGEHLGPATGQPPRELRDRVLAAARPSPRPTTRIGAIRRSPFAAALASAAAVLVVLAALVVPAVAGDATRPTTVSTADAPRALSGADVLQQAGRTLAGAAEATVRPGQFRYTETVGVNQTGPGWQALGGRTLIRQWWSADGGQGQVMERPLDPPDAAWRPGSAPGFDSAVPTDADAMFAYLYRPAGADFPGSADDRAWQRAVDVLVSGRNPTAARVAALLAMARIPGLSLRVGAVDLTGRSGVAVVHASREQPEVLFDANTYQYLGTNQTRASAGLPGQGTTTEVRIAVRQQGVVDKLGEVP